MAQRKTKLEWNPDNMTVADLRNAAKTLRSIMESADNAGDDFERIGLAVAQYQDAYEVV